MSEEGQDFRVIISESKDGETVIATSTSDEYEKILTSAWSKFSNSQQYSVLPKDNVIGNTDLTDEEYHKLAKDAQSNLQSVIRIGQLSRYHINKDDLIGKVYETIESNINSNLRLSFEIDEETENYQEDIVKAKSIIKKFNKSAKISNFVKKAIPMTYAEGNYISYLRGNKKEGYVIDYYPLGLSIISDYEVNGEPVVMIDLSLLSSSLQKNMPKTKKGKPYFFKAIGEEIKKNYPNEIYEGYANKETLAKLDYKRTGVIRINNMNRKYGLTPIFRTFKSAGMLDVYEKADKTNTKAKAKKIIFLKLHKEILGMNYDQPALDKMAYAHNSFMDAFKHDTVVFTAPAFVEDVKYVEPKIETNNSTDVQTYRSKIMTALGIAFLNSDSKQTFTVANMTIAELMKTINKISEQAEACIEKWYEIVLAEHGISSDYVPKVQIIDSEIFSNEVKLQLVEILFSKLNMSYETAFELLGYSVEEEAQRRANENEKGLDKIFTPRLNAYTASGDDINNNGGRPINNNDPDKQINDQTRRQTQ